MDELQWHELERIRQALETRDLTPQEQKRLSQAHVSELDKARFREAQDTRRALERKQQPKNPVVIAFGRFQPPTTGHQRLISFAVQTSNMLGGCPVIVFPSVKQDADDNPLSFIDKVRILRSVWPEITISANQKVKTPIDALLACSLLGFDSVTLVAGSDRAQEFQKFGQYVKPSGLQDGKSIILKDFQVRAVPQERKPTAHDVSGMSGGKLRQAARDGDWNAFRRGTPTRNVRVAKDIYDTLRRNVGLMEQKPIFFLYGTSTRARKALHEGFETVRRAHPNVKCLTISEDASFGAIRDVVQRAVRKGYAPTIYVLDASLPAQISEQWMKRQTTCGLLYRQFAKNIVPLGAYGVTEAVTHAEVMLEDAASGPKQPTEVDRLRVSQGKEKIAMQQRQSNEVLQAKSRELQKKAREQQQKLSAPKKPQAR